MWSAHPSQLHAFTNLLLLKTAKIKKGPYPTLHVFLSVLIRNTHNGPEISSAFLTRMPYYQTQTGISCAAGFIRKELIITPRYITKIKNYNNLR